MTETSIEHDVVIIGGGPAGLAAAIWCNDLSLNSILIEKRDEVGGQLMWIHNSIRNYPGLNAANGRDLRDRMVDNLPGICRIVTGDEMVSADLRGKTVELASGKILRGRAVVIATGIRRNRLGIPGELDFCGRGVLESGAASRNKVEGKSVVIVGGGDAAAENALMLSETAANVTLVHRGWGLSCREVFRREIGNRENIELLFSAQVTRIDGDETVRSVNVSGLDGSAERNMPCDHVLIRIGVSPNSEMFLGQTEVTSRGYIVTARDGAASVSGVYAVGDVAWPQSPTIATAVGSAAAAIKTIALGSSSN